MIQFQFALDIVTKIRAYFRKKGTVNDSISTCPRYTAWVGPESYFLFRVSVLIYKYSKSSTFYSDKIFVWTNIFFGQQFFGTKFFFSLRMFVEKKISPKNCCQ